MGWAIKFPKMDKKLLNLASDCELSNILYTIFQKISLLYTIVPIGVGGHFFHVILFCSKAPFVPLNAFFLFFQITHFVNEMPSDFKCNSVCRANRISDNSFKMPIFHPKFNFFEILKANMVKHPDRVMTI